MITIKKHNIASAMRTWCVGTFIGLSTMASIAGNPISIRHLASEQNIISIKQEKRYLLLPVQDNAPEGQIYLIVGNQRVSNAIHVRLAREKVDYFVPLDLSAYDMRNLSIDIQGMPASAICWEKMELSDTFDLANTEKFRSAYHHTPAYGWMNDPNGMFYKDGVYHLYFQHNPYGSTWGNMTWGHSTSKDLANWEYQGDAIVPDAWGAIFSGSCVVDYENTAGFGEGAVVALYTSAKATPWGDVQSQSLAYSLDNGQTFIKYDRNPILTSQERDFRDPKVFWYAPGKHWVMLLAVGQEMQIFSSPNLKEWKKESSFGAMQGAHGGVWECPDLVELPVEGSKEKKWVLLCNINPGGPFGGSATQYFVGTFDGKIFTNESPTLTKWMDWGKDNYATVTWSNAPDGRCIALGWMSNWQYQGVLPTKQYRGTNTIARDLTLFKAGGELYLKSTPSVEINQFRKKRAEIASLEMNKEQVVSPLFEGNEGAYEIEMTLLPGNAEKACFSLQNGKGERLDMYYDMRLSQFVMDRSLSGDISFSKEFPAVTAAPVWGNGPLKLRIFVDKSSIEVFGNEGRFVMTNRIFPSESYNTLRFEASGKNVKVRKLVVYSLVD